MATLFDVPLNESVQILKRVLPLMSQQRVPTIPQNYAVWYDYVTKRNDELSLELDQLIDKGEDFDSASCRTIHEKYFISELQTEVDGIQGAVREALESVLLELGGLGDDIEQFADVLDRCGVSLQEEPTPDELNKLVVELVRETARTRSRSKEFEGSLHNMAGELSDLREQVDRLSKDSRTDALTRVANRRAFDEALKRLAKESRDTRAPMSLILVDIDHFKSFNDTHGHLIGDHVLRFVAQEMEQCVKGRDILARYGGEEFAILLPSTPLKGAMMLANSIRALVESQRIQNDKGDDLDTITISLGVSQYVAEEALSSFVSRADECMYASKENGRNRVTGEDELVKH
jgi:diguanylate cyclase